MFGVFFFFFFLFNVVEVMGTSAKALKILSCFKVELIIILRLTGQRTKLENKKENMNLHFYLQPFTITNKGLM